MHGRVKCSSLDTSLAMQLHKDYCTVAGTCLSRSVCSLLAQSTDPSPHWSSISRWRQVRVLLPWAVGCSHEGKWPSRAGVSPLMGRRQAPAWQTVAAVISRTAQVTCPLNTQLLQYVTAGGNWGTIGGGAPCILNL